MRKSARKCNIIMKNIYKSDARKISREHHNKEKTPPKSPTHPNRMNRLDKPSFAFLHRHRRPLFRN